MLLQLLNICQGNSSIFLFRAYLAESLDSKRNDLLAWKSSTACICNNHFLNFFFPFFFTCFSSFYSPLCSSSKDLYEQQPSIIVIASCPVLCWSAIAFMMWWSVESDTAYPMCWTTCILTSSPGIGRTVRFLWHETQLQSVTNITRKKNASQWITHHTTWTACS